jgi:hypothetical protein
MSEQKQRKARLLNRQSGNWGTASTMYFHAVVAKNTANKTLVVEIGQEQSEGPAVDHNWLLSFFVPYFVTGIGPVALAGDSCGKTLSCGFSMPRSFCSGWSSRFCNKIPFVTGSRRDTRVNSRVSQLWNRPSAIDRRSRHCKQCRPGGCPHG